MTGSPFILTGTSNEKLAKDIGQILGLEVHYPTTFFADGEIRVVIEESLRRSDIFIIQPTSPPVNDHLMELLLMIDAAKRASAGEITAVVPYFGYSRQDRKDKPRVPISSALVAELFGVAGANRIFTLDIHSEQQMGFFQGPWDNLYGSYSLIPAIRELNLSDLVVASPDKNGFTKAVAYAKRLNVNDLALVYKERDFSMNNKSKAVTMIGEVSGKNVLIVDDIIDTATTLVNAANLMVQRGAKAVFAAATHGLFSAGSLQKIADSSITKVFTTDTIRIREEIANHSKIKVVTVAPLLAEAIMRIKEGKSLNKNLII